MNIRNEFSPGDIGELTRLHGILYHKEYGFDNTFEAYVARGVAEFVLNNDQGKARFWIVEDERKIVGSMAIVKFSEDVAQLRWFLLHPDLRGQGLGKRLIAEALEFCREKKYTSVFLWTASELKAASSLYLKAGFVKTEEKSHLIWGDERTEERYDLVL